MFEQLIRTIKVKSTITETRFFLEENKKNLLSIIVD